MASGSGMRQVEVVVAPVDINPVLVVPVDTEIHMLQKHLAAVVVLNHLYL